MSKGVCSAVLVIAVLSSVAIARADEFDHVRDLTRQRMAEEHVPGMSVAVARQGKIIWEEGFGWANVERRTPATENTVYSLASVTKPISATALMILSEHGKINLEKPVNSYLGSVKLKAWQGRARDATVGQMASHMAGLPEHYHFFYADNPGRPPSMDETIRRYGNIMERPGERFGYSNLGYGILGYLIARASGRSFGAVLQDEVFRPLGMSSARFGAQICDQCATRYDDNGEPLPAYDFDHAGASAAWASAHDLLLFGLFHAGTPMPQQRRVLSDADRVGMQQIRTDQARGYGIGWNVWRHPDGYSVVYHGGNMPGASADLTVIPEKQIVVVVLANRSCSLPYRINDEIIYKTLLPAAKPDPAQAKPQNQPAAEPVKASWEGLIGAWAGGVHTYQGLRSLALEVHSSEDVDVMLAGKRSKLSKVNFRNGLSGEFTGDLGISDARPDSLLVVSLNMHNDKLIGTVTAYSPSGHRTEYGLSQWAEASKQESRRIQ